MNRNNDITFCDLLRLILNCQSNIVTLDDLGNVPFSRRTIIDAMQILEKSELGSLAIFNTTKREIKFAFKKTYYKNLSEESLRDLNALRLKPENLNSSS